MHFVEECQEYFVLRQVTSYFSENSELRVQSPPLEPVAEADNPSLLARNSNAL